MSYPLDEPTVLAHCTIGAIRFRHGRTLEGNGLSGRPLPTRARGKKQNGKKTPELGSASYFRESLFNIDVSRTGAQFNQNATAANLSVQFARADRPLDGNRKAALDVPGTGPGFEVESGLLREP